MIYFCPTPIGNLGDITIRTVEVLNNVDLIYAEDTRVSGVLLKYLGISKPLRSFHKHNEGLKIEEVLNFNGDIAVITDAGMPGISDPGAELISALIEREVDFTVLPGANAALVGLIGSGLSTEHFYFYGFLNSKKSARDRELNNLREVKETIVFYEAPHRIVSTLESILEVLGNRRVSLGRELTKLHEEFIRGSVEEILQKGFTEKGEFVLVLEGAGEEEVEIDIKKILQEYIEEGYSKSQAVKEISKKYNLSKNKVYNISLEE